jgi:hypothetical protein
MHIDAFFEYLLGTPHAYWTDLPSTSDPVGDEDRDGVAAEDDMALRALLPEIRPRRGRRKADEEGVGQQPSQRLRLSSPSGEATTKRGKNTAEPWTAFPEAGKVFLLPSAEQARATVIKPPDAARWVSGTPASLYPQSAITPAVRHGLWADEPQSAVTPSKYRNELRRHGAKAVSSAWRAGGIAGPGKRPRGRPPAVRPAESTPQVCEEAVEDAETSQAPSATRSTELPTDTDLSNSTRTAETYKTTGANAETSPIGRPSRPEKLSLQVPQRTGGSVRLATPPPPPISKPAPSEPVLPPKVVVNGANPALDTDKQQEPVPHPTINGSRKNTTLNQSSSGTHRARLESFLASEFMSASWHDSTGQGLPPCRLDEALLLADAVFRSVEEQSTSKHDLLINLSTLAGFRMLRADARKTTVIISKQSAYETVYVCEWPLQFGDTTGSFSMTVDVSRADLEQIAKSTTSVVYWKQKYQDLLYFGAGASDSSGPRDHLEDGLIVPHP